MGSDLPYYLTMWFLALGVIILCGAGISYGYVNEGRWGQRRGEKVESTPQKAQGVLVDRATADQEERKLAA